MNKFKYIKTKYEPHDKQWDRIGMCSRAYVEYFLEESKIDVPEEIASEKSIDEMAKLIQLYMMRMLFGRGFEDVDAAYPPTPDE